MMVTAISQQTRHIETLLINAGPPSALCPTLNQGNLIKRTLFLCIVFAGLSL